MPSTKMLVKNMLGHTLGLFKRQKCIIFESLPDLSDNTMEVFHELVQRGYGDKYTLVWSCSKHSHSLAPYPNIQYIYPMEKGIKARLRNAYYMANAKCMLSCNRFLKPWRDDQTAFYLMHGAPIKAVQGYYAMPESIHYCIAPSKEMEEITAQQLHIAPHKVVALGYPRNDILTQPACPVKEILGTRCNKVIVWYPTFRQHSLKSNISSGQAMPVIHDSDAATELNDWAQQQDVLIVMKPHFAQDLSYIKDLGLSHIRFIDDAFFREHNTSSYAFVAGCDALLTDYSSIYFDYLLCDKPVGLIWEDIDEYRQNPGFAVDMDEIGKGASIIYNLLDFKQFIREVAEDADPHKTERNALCDRVNYSRDGKNTQRVTDFIIEKAQL